MVASLVGYARKSEHGGALKLNIHKEAFLKAEKYVSKTGDDYVSLVISLDKVQEIITGQREVVSVCQVVEI